MPPRKRVLTALLFELEPVKNQLFNMGSYGRVRFIAIKEKIDVRSRKGLGRSILRITTDRQVQRKVLLTDTNPEKSGKKTQKGPETAARGQAPPCWTGGSDRRAVRTQRTERTAAKLKRLLRAKFRVFNFLNIVPLLLPVLQTKNIEQH